jgi:hypothetical protein
VRGLPPDAATPLVPVTGPLRLGLIDPAGRAPGALTEALDGLGTAIEVRRLAGGARAALQEAAGDGLEILHIVSDGSVTAALDGVLEFPDVDEPPLGAIELSRYLHGSRVRLLALTPCSGDDPASTSIGRWVAPSAHRAFSYFATTSQPLPTVVAPLGPLDEWNLKRFWSEFYAGLGDTHEIEASMARAQSGQPSAVALFLRQLQVPTFRRVAAEDRPAVEPSMVSAELASSKQAIGEIQALKERLGLKTASLDDYVERESARQSTLESNVEPWVEGVQEE